MFPGQVIFKPAWIPNLMIWVEDEAVKRLAVCVA